jgi:DNA-binding MurR/RpiR family transcriptional regulator
MLIKEKIKYTKFTSAEQLVIDFLLTKREDIASLSLREAAKDCYTYPSTFVRVSKKLGYNGWNELKNSYLEEIRYLDSKFSDIDANFPFKTNEPPLTIVSKMSQLAIETIQDTVSLIHHDSLSKAIQLLIEASEIKIFARNHNNIIAQEFVLRMNRLGRSTSISNLDGEQLFDAYNAKEGSCALFISYSGESVRLERTISILKQKGIPIILLTSIGTNSLSKLADCILHISTREKLYSKIGNFSVITSTSHLLDIIYACIFSKDFQKNRDHLINISLQADGRKSYTEIIKEEP